jgi:hypothetical protein
MRSGAGFAGIVVFCSCVTASTDLPTTEAPTSTVTDVVTTSATTTPSTTTISTTTAKRTTPAPILHTPRVLKMTAKFEIGGLKNFRSPIPTKEGYRAACPSNLDYCIDIRHSDWATCMYPPPLSVKKCLDQSCKTAPGNVQVFKAHGEDSYCKDYANTPAGRVCHWMVNTFCTCDKFDIQYVDAVLIAPSERVPFGWKVPRTCEYPDNYKATNERELAEHQTFRPAGIKGAGGRRANDANSFGITKALVVIVLLALVSM